MELDLDKYSINRPFIAQWYKDMKDREPMGRVIALCSASTHCPFTALAFYLGESLGYPPEIVAIIDKMIAFYGYKTILNQPDNSPYLTMDRKRDIK